MTVPSESHPEIYTIYVIVERHDADKYDFGLPIIAFYNRKEALEYKRVRGDRALVIRRLEVH